MIDHKVLKKMSKKDLRVTVMLLQLTAEEVAQGLEAYTEALEAKEMKRSDFIELAYAVVADLKVIAGVKAELVPVQEEDNSCCGEGCCGPWREF